MSVQFVPIHPGPTPIILISRPVVLVGRHPECDVRIDSPQVSRRHCCIAVAYDRLMIRDLGSRNGIRLNGLVIEESRLKPGDEIAIGPFLYRIESLGAAGPAPRPARPVPEPPPSDESLPPIIDLDDDFIPIED